MHQPVNSCENNAHSFIGNTDVGLDEVYSRSHTWQIGDLRLNNCYALSTTEAITPDDVCQDIGEIKRRVKDMS